MHIAHVGILPENIEWREPTFQRHLRIEAERVKRVLSVREKPLSVWRLKEGDITGI